MNFVVAKQADCGYFSVEIQLSGHPCRLRLIGELDLGSAQLVSDALMQWEVQQAGPLVIDMAGVSFMDCSGLSVLLGAYNRACRDNRELTIINPQPPVRRIFGLTGCGYMLSEPTREPLKA